MSKITAGFDGTNNITITRTSPIPLSEFNKLASPPMTYTSYDGSMATTDANKFIVEQQTINFLDTVKDGGGSLPFASMIDGLGMYEKRVDIGSTTEFRGIGSALTNLEQATFEHATIKPYFYDRSWTKGQKKNNRLGRPLPFKNIFYDVGLAPESYIVKPFDIINTFGKYMDPSKAGDSSTKYWPPKDKTLVFDASFMELFGFENSRIEATKIQGDKKWNYNLKASGEPIKWNGVNQDPNSNLFAGNASKNTILKQSGQRELKKSLLMLKEWGDKFQVLTAFVWSSLNKDTYAVVTNDKVVALLCTILKLNCIQYVEKQVKGEPKKYTIKVYESSMTPNTDAAKRYNSTRKEIIAHNKDYIKLIGQLSIETALYVGGTDIPVYFPNSFYDAVVTDLMKINKVLDDRAKKLENETESAEEIEAQIKDMKSEFTFDRFIREIGGTMKILQKTNYTSTIKEKPSFVKSPYNITEAMTMSFYNIGRRMFAMSVPSGGATNDRQSMFKRGLNMNQAVEKRKNTRDAARKMARAQEQQKKRDEPSWDDTDFYSEPIYEWQEEVNEVQNMSPSQIAHQAPYLIETTMKKVDINELLRENIKIALARANVPEIYKTIFDTIYSSVLHWSYVNSGVPLEPEDLYQLIADPANGIFQNLSTEADMIANLREIEAVQQARTSMSGPAAISRFGAMPSAVMVEGGRRTRKHRKNNKNRTTKRKRSRIKIKRKRTKRKKHRERKKKKRTVKSR